MNVAICIATYNRPHGLQLLLESLNHLDFAGHTGVFIADNDGERHEGFDYVSRNHDDYKFPIRCEIEPAAGISHARNKALQMVQQAKTYYDYIALVDDDMVVSPHWISDLLRTMTMYKADAVFGKREPRFDMVPADEILHSRYFHDDFFCQPTGSEMDEGGTCNVMFARKIFDAVGFDAFDLNLGLAGGEDIDLCKRLKAKGYRFVQCASALAFENFPPERLNAVWILNRYFRGGSTYAYILKKNSGRSVFLFGALKKLMKLPRQYFEYCLHPTLDRQCQLYNTLGFLHFLKNGVPFQEYKRAGPDV